MSKTLDNFKICRKISNNIKKQVKYFYVFNLKSHSNVLLITFNDKIYGLGYNNFGVLGLGHDNRVKELTEIKELNGYNIKEFYNGSNFVIGVNNDKNILFGWGMNNAAQLGRGYKSEFYDYLRPEKVKLFDNKSKFQIKSFKFKPIVIQEISCGSFHTLVLTKEGLLYGWGWNEGGQIGIYNDKWKGDSQSRRLDKNLENYIFIRQPKEIEYFSKNRIKIKSILCSIEQSFILTEEYVYSFGSNSNYRLGHELIANNEIVFIPKRIKSLNNIDIKSIGFSRENTYFLTTDGFLYFCGSFNQKKIKLTKIESEIKFNDLYSKDGITIAINDYSNEIFEFRSNSINKTEFSNIFDFYANITHKEVNIGFTYKTTSINGFGFQRFNKLYTIGSGSFGSVIKVKDQIYQNIYAIKIIGISNFTIIQILLNMIIQTFYIYYNYFKI